MNFLLRLARPLLAGVLLLSAAPALAGQTPARDSGNLLVNPGFESPYVKQCCHTEPGLEGRVIDEVQVATGWFGWWYPPGIDAAHPEYCGDASTEECQAWHRPEWREAAPFTERIRQGKNAQKYFTFWSVHEAGMYQQVNGLPAGARLRFSVYMHAWSNNEDQNYSAGQDYMGMKVGLDPTGGTNPWSPNIVWSAAQSVFDNYQLFTVEAVAAGGPVTVFTHSQPHWGYKHNDVYVDDASLIILGADAPASLAQPTAGAGSTAEPAATAGAGSGAGASSGVVWSAEAFPPGSETYTVADGDTLWTIATRNGLTVDDLQLLNNIAGTKIYVGQVLLLQAAATAEPTQPFVLFATAGPTEVVEEVAEVERPPEEVAGSGAICLSVFEDVEGNGAREPAGAAAQPPAMSVDLLHLTAGAAQVVGQVRTGESNDARCFTELRPANYRLALHVPAGFVVTTSEPGAIALATGEEVDLEIGLAPEAALAAESDRGRVLPAAGAALAALLAAYAGGVLVYRRRMLGRRSAPNVKER